MDHYWILIVAGYWVFSAIVGGMPEPHDHSKFAYRWLFKSLHILAGNMTTAMARYYPQGSVPADSLTGIQNEPNH